MGEVRIRVAMKGTCSDEGASAVEFGLVAPALFLILLGIMQFGLLFAQTLQVEAAAREGARWASLRNPGPSVIERVRQTAAGVDLSDGSAISLSPADPTSPLLAENSDVVVTVRANVPVILPFFADMMDEDGDGLYTIDATARQRIE